MKLPIQLPFTKKDDKEYYLSLLLNDEKAHATVFAEHNGKIEVIGEKETHFHTPLEQLSEENLLDILDKTVTSAESNLPDGYETRKTIFGVKENWIEDTKIKKEYLVKLKKICDALGLTPIGFLVIHEAIAHLLQQEEGAPVSAILTEVGEHEVAVSILRAGKLLETKHVPMGESLAKTIDKTLLSFTSYEILPSRIILFNVKNHEKLSQELIAHQWSKSLPFLHVPQIKILPHTYESRSLLFGAATQMGFEVVDKYDMPLAPTDHREKEETMPERKAQTSDENFGFVEDTDIAKTKDSTKQSEADDGDIHDDMEDTVIQDYNQEFFDSEHQESTPTPRQKSPLQQKMKHFFHTAKAGFATFAAKLPNPSFLSRFPLLKKNKGLIFLPPALIGLLLILFVLYIFGLKSTVVLHIDPKTVEKNQDITFSTKQSSDPSQNIIAAEMVSTTQDGSASTTATGKKEVGDKAKGAVTIYSRISQSKTFPAGTVISGPDGLKFSLDKDVSVASSSGDASSSPATANVSVTASAIGKESNLPSGSKFTIAGFSEGDAVAKNSEAFSGGSKKDITIIAKADVAKITNSLPKTLEAKAKGDLEGKLDANKVLLPIFLSTNIEKKTLDKNIGDEASSVTLHATVSFDSAAYTKSEVESYAYSVLSADNSALSPAKESLSYTLSDISENGGDISGKINIKGFLLPKVDKEDIATQIAGKSFTDAQTILQKLPQVKSVDINLHPGLPFFPSFLPRMPKNITIEVATNG
jgi:hypothetical protein